MYREKVKEGETFWSWLRGVRVRSLVVVLVPCLLLPPLILLLLLPRGEGWGKGAGQGSHTSDTARRVLGLIHFDHLSGPEIKARIEELLRIKDSVQAELGDLVKKRAMMQEEIASLSARITQLKSEGLREARELERVKVSVEQVRLKQQELTERNTPHIAPPLPLLPGAGHWKMLPPPKSHSECTAHTCFDFSRCSITSQFPVFVYPLSQQQQQDREAQLLHSAFLASSYSTAEASSACMFIVMYTQGMDLRSLQHWQGDGRNHLLVDIQGTAARAETGRALIQSPSFSLVSWVPGHHLVLPPAPASPVTWSFLPSLVPTLREVLLSFQGEFQPFVGNEVESPSPESLAQGREVVSILKDMTVSGTNDKFSFSFSCQASSSSSPPCSPGEWCLCGSQESRLSVLKESTWCLVIPPALPCLSTPSLQLRLTECLRAGSVPVILGSQALLPLQEVVAWRQAALLLPTSRVTELHFLLRTFSHEDIFSMKRQGRLILQHYLASAQHVVEASLALLRDRLSIPALPLHSSPSPSVFNSSFNPLILEQLPAEVEPDESLGPLEPPYPSPAFTRNYSLLLSHSHYNWNSVFLPVSALPPSTPWGPDLPTEEKFLGTARGFRPINSGEGGSGKEFSQALGGNSPQEQFTVVMLTYEREHVLINSLARLYGLPYLNKVVVVWNSPNPPPEDLQWPDIGVPIVVLRTEKNSLNNRFLPFSEIETDAVLSVDDDAHLRHDEIVFGFRVWREHRDRLVGFPGRFHAWDSPAKAWNYNSNYSCELSMVLTGAAFYHRYYNYLYSSNSQAMSDVRDLVDKLMNCEDLAMNFLISHITRKPPVKVTSRWTFRCPGCPVSLSEDDSHFQERHSCMNLLSRVYGYMPLLYTQYRADSVLFKTRIPPDKQKCFKFI